MKKFRHGDKTSLPGEYYFKLTDSAQLLSTVRYTSDSAHSRIHAHISDLWHLKAECEEKLVTAESVGYGSKPIQRSGSGDGLHLVSLGINLAAHSLMIPVADT